MPPAAVVSADVVRSRRGDPLMTRISAPVRALISVTEPSGPATSDPLAWSVDGLDRVDA
jgi:hypothetical protein